MLGGARIDNNRREYFVSRAAQLCVHACVLRIFFSLRSFIKFVLKIIDDPQKRKVVKAMTLVTTLFLRLVVFYLCENRQQPT